VRRGAARCDKRALERSMQFGWLQFLMKERDHGSFTNANFAKYAGSKQWEIP